MPPPPSAPGTTTARDVARRAGVSQTTVSLVLNGTADQVGLATATQARVRLAAEELGYVPNRAARNLRRRRSGNITFISPDVGNPYFAEVIVAVQEVAQRHGYLMDIIAANDEAEKLQAIARLGGGISDGIITSAPTQAVWDGLQGLSARGVACVTLQDQGGDPAIPAVCIDLELGGHTATRHLIGLGHRRIAYVSGRQSFPLRARERVHGYRRALREAGLPEDRVEHSNSMAGGAEAVEALLSRPGPRPDALFVFNDLMAVGVLHALRRHKLRVPDDMAVVGFDGIALGDFTTPTLTTVRHPRAELGRAAASSLIRLMQRDATDVPSTLLPGLLVVRESCGGQRSPAIGRGGAAA